MGARLRQWAAVLLLGIAPLALVEGGLRLFGWPTERVRTLGKLLNFDADSWNGAIGVFRPGARSTVMWPPELAYEVHINGLGLRGPEIAPTPPAGRQRILALGDSMTFGYYLEEDETWPAQLEARLRATGQDVEVVNGGSGGWSIESHAKFLEERALSLAPDHVVIGFCANDIADLSRGGAVFEGQKRAVGGGRGALTEAVYTSATYELYLRAKVWWKHFRESRSGELDHALTSVDVPPDQRDALWERYAEWLDRLHATLTEAGIPLTLVYIPDAYKLENDLPATDAERLRQLARDRGIGFASPLARFEANPDAKLFHLPLDPHLAVDGAALVASAVEQALADADDMPAPLPPEGVDGEDAS